MTAINFPNSPSNGDTQTVGSTTYTYNSTKGYWDATPTGSAITLSSLGESLLPSTDVSATSSGIQLPELTIGTGTTTVKLGVAADGSVTQTSTVSGTASSPTTSVALTDLSITSASASAGGTLSYASATGVFTYTPPDLSVKADLASPTFTGTPIAPTAGASTNTTQIATTAFVTTALAGLIDSAP